MYDLKILGRNIKRCRQVRGLTQEDLAKKVGLTKDTISKIELGKQENVGLKYLISISRELNVELEQLFMADPESKFIKLVISDQNARNLKRIFNEIVSRFTKKEGK
ncbi:helix-turn-helix domain-containing protein [bacterium]|nr:helix-turn-helix domain-containing protein [bacterium]